MSLVERARAWPVLPRTSGFPTDKELVAMLADRIEALEAALADIARQKKTEELETEYDVEIADFETGYDAIIDVARKALNPSS